MQCELCGAEHDGGPVLIENENGERVTLPLCNDCLGAEDTFALVDFIQSKIDLAKESRH